MVVQCSCGKRYRIKANAIGRKARCQACGSVMRLRESIEHEEASTRSPVTPTADIAPSPPLPTPTFTVRPLHISWLLLASLSWILLGALLGQLAPYLGFLPLSVAIVGNMLPPGVTVVLIGANLLVSVRLLRRTGHAVSALPLACMQLPLFMVLFFQIACHFGAEYYKWDEPPAVGDWIEFALAHAFRAGDMIDSLDVSGIKLQTIHSNSHLVAGAVIAYHLVVDVFLIEMLMEWVERAKLAVLRRERLRRLLRRGCIILAWGVVISWLVTVLWWRHWELQDLLLWPLQNFLAVVDFADVMEIYEVRLHHVPKDGWLIVLAILVRILIAIALADVLSRVARSFRRRWLARFALSEEAFRDIRAHHPKAAVRQWAEARLEVIRVMSENRPSHRATLSRILAMLSRRPLWISGLVLIIALVLLPSWSSVAETLARVAIDPESQQADSSLLALRKMGRHAESAVPILAEGLQSKTHRKQLAIVATLPYMGPAAIEPLSDAMRSPIPELSVAAVHALATLGPDAAPLLVDALNFENEEVQSTATAAMQRFGDAAVEPLIDAITRQSAASLLPVLVDLDPYWYQRRTENPDYSQVVACWMAMQALENSDTADEVVAATRELSKLGPFATPAIPLLAHYLTDENATIRHVTTEALPQIDQDWTRILVDSRYVDSFADRLKHTDPGVRWAACDLLGQIGPGALRALPQLRACVGDGQQMPGVLAKAIWAIGQMGPEAVDAVPPLIQHSDHADVQVRQELATAFGHIGGHAAWGAGLALLNDHDEAVRDASYEALTKSEGAVLPLLSGSFANWNGNMKPLVLDLLHDIEQFDDEDVPTLVTGLACTDKDTQERVRSVLDHADANWRSRTETSRLVQDKLTLFLTSADADERSVAIDAVKIIGPNALTVKLLVDAFPTFEADTKNVSLDLLDDWRRNHEESDAFLAAHVPAAMDLLLQSIGSEDTSQAERLLYTLGCIKHPDGARNLKARLDAMLNVIRDPAVPVKTRELLTRMVAKMGPDAKDAVPSLVQLAIDPLSLHNSATQALIALAQPEEQPGRPLDDAEWSPEQHELTQQIIAHCIPMIAYRRDIYITKNVQAVLVSIHSRSMVPVWLDVLKQGGSFGSQDMALGGLMGVAAHCRTHSARGELIPLLFPILSDNDIRLSTLAGNVLLEIGMTPDELPLIQEALRDNPHRIIAWDLVAQLGPAALPAMRDIVAAHAIVLEATRVSGREFRNRYYANSPDVADRIKKLGPGAVPQLHDLATEQDLNESARALLEMVDP